MPYEDETDDPHYEMSDAPQIPATAYSDMLLSFATIEGKVYIDAIYCAHYVGKYSLFVVQLYRSI